MPRMLVLEGELTIDEDESVWIEGVRLDEAIRRVFTRRRTMTFSDMETGEEREVPVFDPRDVGWTALRVRVEVVQC